LEPIAEFLSRLRSLDIRLSVEGERLGCSAPKGALTAELKAQLVNRKGEILEFLRLSETAGSTSPQIRRVERGGTVPLSYGQQRLWFLNRFEPNSAAYNITGVLRLTGKLDRSALQGAMAAILERHEVLRTALIDVDGSPKAVIGPAEGWSIEIRDLRHIDEAEREDTLQELARREVRRELDVAEGILLRAILFEFAERDHALVLVIHHIAADGWSLAVFVQELAQLYTAFCEGNPSPLTELPVGYADFAAWQKQMLESGVLQSQLPYWKRQLQGKLPVIELPSDRPRPAVMSLRGARRQFRISGPLTAALNEFSRTEGVTLFMTLMAAFNVLLFRYTRQDDLPVGSAVAGRTRPEFEKLIGLFINNLVLRTSLAGDPTGRELIARVREVALDAFAHQDVPFDHLVAVLQPERDLNHSPLFQVMFILQNFPMRSFELPGLTVTPVVIDAGTSRFDLTVEAAERDGALMLDFEYNTDLFDEATIARMARHYERLLESLVSGPDRRISALEILTEAESREIRAEAARTRTEYPRELCVHELIEHRAARVPEAAALRFGEQRICYAELMRRANRLANRLRRVGIGPEARVGIAVERTAEIVVAVLGVLKAGGAYVPLDPAYPPERLAFMMEDAAISVLVTDERSRRAVPSAGLIVVSLDGERESIAAESDQAPASGVTPENPAYVIYTSGSTGKPKGVEIPHRAVVNFLEDMRREPGLAATDRLLAVTTLSFDIAGLEIYLPLVTGAEIVLAPRAVTADGRALARLLEESEATVMQATPATWRLLVEAGWEPPSNLKILCGGEALPRELANRLTAGGAEVWNLYGPTETTIWSLRHKVEPAGAGPVPIGRPIANTEIYVLDEHRQPVPAGVPGELYIGGDGLARGYLNRAELTRERFVAHPFAQGERLYRTGDLVRRRADGIVEFLGRLDHQIKIRGFRIELGEIEAVLEQCTGVGQAVVVMREDTPGDQRLAAYVTAKPGHNVASRELRQAVAERLPEYMVPSAFVRLEAFPLTPNGKVDRKALPAPDARAVRTVRYASPRSQAEREVAAIWKDLLKAEQVGVHDNFFDLGGHSLLVVQLQNRLRQSFGRELALVDLFRKPTVAAMAEFLGSKPETVGAGAERH